MMVVGEGFGCGVEAVRCSWQRAAFAFSASSAGGLFPAALGEPFTDVYELLAGQVDADSNQA